MPLPLGRSPSVIMPSNPSNSSFVEGSPNFLTAGNPVLCNLNFKVKGGPISCNAAFSVGVKAYLDAHEPADRYKVIGPVRTNPTCDARRIGNLGSYAAWQPVGLGTGARGEHSTERDPAIY